MGIALDALPWLDAGDFRLRPWVNDNRDLALLSEASRDPLIPPASSVPAHGTDDELRAYMERNLARLGDGAGCQFVIDDLSEQRPIGSITVLDDGRNRGRASIGYWVVPSAHSWRGFARVTGIRGSRSTCNLRTSVRFAPLSVPGSSTKDSCVRGRRSRASAATSCSTR